MNKDYKYWLRWVAVLPGALIAGLLATFPLHWLLYIAFAYDGTILGCIELPPGSNLPIEYMLYPFVIAFVFILVGFKIAPMYKFKTAIALAVLYTIFAIGVLFFGMKRGIKMSFEVRTVGPFIGLLIGLYIANKEENNRKLGTN